MPLSKNLLEHYEVELTHLRQMAGEFQTGFPKVAARLALGQDPPDPYVERLLEGFAYLTARVQLKLDAEFPRFNQALLETIYPDFLAPTPAMAIIRLQPNEEDKSLAAGLRVARGIELKSLLAPGQNTECVFTTSQDVRLLPLRVIEARYFTRDLNELGLPADLPVGAPKAALRLRLQATAGLKFRDIKLEELTMHIAPNDDRAGLLYEQIFGRKSAVVLQSVTKPIKVYGVLPPERIERVGFTDEEALLPPDPRSFSGYRLLREYFAFPRRFLFFRLKDEEGPQEKPFATGTQRCLESQLDIIVLFNESESRLEGRVDKDCFQLFCTPAINLFTKRHILIDLQRQRSEYPVIPEKQNTIDYEVYQVKQVTGVGGRGTRQFLPFYLTPPQPRDCAAFYTINRVRRSLTDREVLEGPASDLYRGMDVYISLVDTAAAPYSPELSELDVTALCTNRHLPIQMNLDAGPMDLICESGLPLASVKCLAKTNPIASPAEGDLAWQTISHLSLNYLSLLDNSASDGAAALRQLLGLYTHGLIRQGRDLLEGLLSVRSTSVVRRVEAPGALAFARGRIITVKVDDTKFGAADVFLFGAVLEQFFRRYVSLNSFTETVLTTERRGEIMRWATRPGKRENL